LRRPPRGLANPDGPIPKLQPTYGEVADEYGRKELQIGDPTTLILVDEADRLRMASLELKMVV